MRGAAALAVLLALAGRGAARFVIEENSVLLPSSSEYHAYENAWSVNFDNVNAVDFDMLIVEMCAEQPCPAQLDGFSGLMGCEDLPRAFNDSAWVNQYIASQVRSSVEALCETMHAVPDWVQVDANVVVRDALGRPWVTLRQPLSLQIANDPEMLALWGRELNATEERLNTTRAAFEMTLRVTQELNLQRRFAFHQSLVRVVVVAPTPASIVFSVENPCAARGYSAPEFGAVTMRQVDSAGASGAPAGARERCVWTCRMDMMREPYNSAPPTREQLNASRPEFEPAYACRALPRDWVATFFGFEVHTRMIATSEEYTQVLYDALDSMARAVEGGLARRGVATTVALSVHSSLYHPLPFRELLREQAEATCLLTQCENTWFPDAEGWTNQNFVYARRRRHARHAQRRRTMGVHALVVDGMLVGRDLGVLVEDSDRLQTISLLRDAVYASGEALAAFSSALQISSVEDFDVAGVVGFVSPKALPPPRTPPGAAAAPSYAIVLLSIGLVVAGVMVLVCALLACEVLALRGARGAAPRAAYHELEDGL
jgi:hypothetical protein